MATLIRHKSGIYHVVFSVKNKRVWRSLRTRDRNLAYQKFLQYEKEGIAPKEAPKMVSEVAASPTSGGVTLQSAVTDYLAFVSANFSCNTTRDYISVMKSFVRFIGAETTVTGITPREIERFKTVKISTNVSPYTVNYNLRCIKAFFNVLIRWGVIERSPCTHVSRIRIDDTIRPYFTREDLSVLLQHAAGTFLNNIILFAVQTGLRLGEIVHLTWVDIMLDKRKILVRSNGTFRTKSGKMRVIPINTELHKLLTTISDKAGLLFTDKNKAPLRAEFVSKEFKKAVRQCGLDPKLHFHSLRHTFGSYLVEQGVSLFHVQQLMGHSSPFVTQIYAHLGSAELMSSVEKINVVV